MSKKMKTSLEGKSIGKLFDMIPKEYMIGPTEFKEPEKKFLACSYYEALYDYQDKIDNDLSEFGIPEKTKVYYGYDLKDVLIQIILDQE